MPREALNANSWWVCSRGDRGDSYHFAAEFYTGFIASDKHVFIPICRVCAIRAYILRSTPVIHAISQLTINYTLLSQDIRRYILGIYIRITVPQLTLSTKTRQRVRT
jgi:hypothetical protein